MKKKSLLITLVLCLTGILVGWYCGTHYYKRVEKKEEKKEEEKKKKNNDVQELSLDDETISFLTELTLSATYFEIFADIKDEQVVEETLFADKKVNISSLSTNFRMSMVLSTIKFDDKTVLITKEEMIAAHKKIFGNEDIAKEFESLLPGNHGKLTLENESYKWARTNEGAGISTQKRLAYKAYKYNDRIEIDYIFANNNLHEMFGNDNFQKVEYYDKNGVNVVFSYDYKDDKFDEDAAIKKNADKFQHYIGTYTKGKDGNYYITSVEPKN